MDPYFFENDIVQAVAVDGHRYHDMLNIFFIPQVESMDIIDTHFQQDGATWHTARENMTLLRGPFPGKLISRFGDVEWPARSPNLSALDLYLWGYLKERVYRDNPKTAELNQAIATEIRSIGPGVTSAVMNSMKKRGQICIQSGGRHMKNIILKKLSEKIPMSQDSNATLLLKIGWLNEKLLHFVYGPVFIDHPYYVYIYICMEDFLFKSN